jgi:hypothetical protein
MKSQIFFFIFFSGLILMAGCNQELHYPHGSDSIKPGKVQVIDVANIPGGAIIKFISPGDPDLLYIVASFIDDKGVKREVKVSGLLNSLKVEGFGRAGNYKIDLFAVDRGENHSDPTTTEISPLDPPIISIFPTLSADSDYGGIKVTFQNEARAEISINVAVYDSLQNSLVYRESYYTSQREGAYSFRGFTSVNTKFGIYLEDLWGNLSDTLIVEAIPIPDEYLEKSKFSIFRIQGDTNFGEYGFSPTQIWNEVWNSQWDCGHTGAVQMPHYLTIDLGAKVKLSRFKLFQRAGTELYKHGNPKYFKVYGTLDVNSLPKYNPDNPNDGWTFLKECRSFKPSGLPVGQFSVEDQEFQLKGEDFEFDINNLVEIRYVRFELIENWEGMNFPYSVIGELSFWGEIIEEIK